MAVLAIATACGGSNQEPISAAGLPPYTSADARVFDDSFAPEIFGLPTDRASAIDDPLLTRRSQRADFAIRAKIVTVSRDARGKDLSYEIVLLPLGPPISGKVLGNVELSLQPGNPFIRLVEHQEATIVGQVVIVLGRYYNVKDQVVIHFRMEPNTPQVLHSVKRARFIDNSET